MAGLLSQWIKDSEKFEMQRSYHVLDQDNFGFLNRQGDFYITLLNRMFFLLEDIDGDDYTEATEVAQGGGGVPPGSALFHRFHGLTQE